MSWLQLKLLASPERAEQIAALLDAAGASAVTFQDAADQPLYEPSPGSTPLWRRTEVNGLFPADSAIDQLLLRLQQSGVAARDCTLERLPEQEWSRSWMDGFHPMRFGERLWICPSWHQPPSGDAVTVTLDPGLAFGTGTHPTTAMCLEWLDSHPPAELQVIDYGCGSGILAIAAVKLGATTATAIDNDPQALLACRDNARNNRVSSHISSCAPEQARPVPCDLLLANILANPLIQLAPRFVELVDTGGRILLSGILEEQASGVQAAYSRWFHIITVRQRDGWVLLEGSRQ